MRLQIIISIITYKNISAGITASFEGVAAAQAEIFLLVAERIADTGEDQIDTSVANAFVNFACVVDAIGIVTGLALQVVDAAQRADGFIVEGSQSGRFMRAGGFGD